MEYNSDCVAETDKTVVGVDTTDAAAVAAATTTTGLVKLIRTGL